MNKQVSRYLLCCIVSMVLSGCVCHEQEWVSRQQVREQLSRQLTEGPAYPQIEMEEIGKGDSESEQVVVVEEEATVDVSTLPAVSAKRKKTKKPKEKIEPEVVRVEEMEEEEIVLEEKEEVILEKPVEETPVVIAKKDPPKETPKITEPKPEKEVSPAEKEFFERWKGECLIYKINWNFLQVGKALVASNEVSNGYGDVYHLVAVTVPEGMLANMGMGYYRIDAFIDRQTLLPRYYYQYNKNKNKEDIMEIFFNKDNKNYQWRLRKYNKGKLYSTKTKTIRPNKDVYDGISSFYMVRTLDYEKKKRFALPIALNEIWDLIVNNKGKKRESIPIIGTKDVYVVEPQARCDTGFFTKGKMDIWITADNKRLPVYLESKVPLGTAKFSIINEIRVPSNIKFNVDTISRLLSQ